MADKTRIQVVYMTQETHLSSSDDSPATLADYWIKAQPILLSFVRSMIYRFDDADDIVQQVATIAAKRFDDFDQSRPFIPWALGIARNVLMHYYRDKKRHNLVLIDNEIMEQMTSTFADNPPGNKDINIALKRCFTQLTDRARNLVQLRYVRDLSTQEIGDRLGTTSNVIAVTLHRIRSTLKKCIEKQIQTSQA